MKKKLLVFVLCLSLSVMFAAGCSKPAEPAAKTFHYPDKPIELVVHTNPGDGVYLFAQTLSDLLSKKLPERMSVVIKSGGSGANAMQYLKTKSGDNYVLCTTQPSTITTPLKNKLDVSYKDFTPIASVITEDYVIVVRQDSPFKTFRELLDYAKANPGKVKQGSGVLGANDTVISSLIEKAAGVDLNLVPFKDGGLMMVGLLSGDVDFISANPSEILEQIRAGKIRPLAIASDQRLPALADVPTMKESAGLDIVFKGFRGIMGPSGMDPEVVAFLEKAIKEVTETEEWKKYLLDNAVSGAYQDSEQLAQTWEELQTMYVQIYTEMGLLK
jgi:putative tricarboxylic transport membrane protein